MRCFRANSVTNRPWVAASALALQLLAAQLLIGAGSLAINIISARALGPSGRGEFALFLQTSYVLAVFCAAGTDKTYLTALKRTPTLGTALRDQRVLLQSPLVAMMLLCILVGATASTVIDGSLMYGLGLALLLAGGIVLFAYRTSSVAAGHAGPYLITVVISQCLLLLGAITLALYGVEDPTYWMLLYGGCFGAAALVVRFLNSSWWQPSHEDCADIQAARKGGLAIMPSAVANIVMLRIDRLLLPFLASFEQLGLYVVVATMTELLNWPVRNYVDANLPQWRTDHSTHSTKKWNTLGFALAYAAGGSALTYGVISLALVPVFGTEYAQSHDLVLPLCIASGLYGVSRVGVGLALSSGCQGKLMWCDPVAMVFAFGAYVFLIPPYGALGAAYGSLLGYAAAAIAAVVVYGSQENRETRHTSERNRV